MNENTTKKITPRARGYEDGSKGKPREVPYPSPKNRREISINEIYLLGYSNGIKLYKTQGHV